MNNIIIIPDVHCRNFYKPALDIKDKTIVFLGDYMDPYSYEGFTDENGIANLEEIIDFARNNTNVHLLVGNHDCSWIWSRLGWERTSQKFYNDLHKLYRDNIDLFTPVLKIGKIIFSHAGITAGWTRFLTETKHDEESVINYIKTEFQKELKRDTALRYDFWGGYLKSPIFDVGYSRGGAATYGGPVWSDFSEFSQPENWKSIQVFSHSQSIETGAIRQYDNGICLDSRAIFECVDNKIILSPLNSNYEKLVKFSVNI